MRVAGVTSTGSKRPEALFGLEEAGLPVRMTQSEGVRVRDEEGREYLDFIMALGAVALGYAHPAVNRAAHEAVDRGAVGPLAPVEEEALAADLAGFMPRLELVRFLKTGAEAVAAAIRLARVHTGRERVLGCGYHGWLDGTSREAGVPRTVAALYGEIPFNDPERSRERIRADGDTLACVVIEPVIDAAPDPEWLRTVREETRRAGAVLVFDEIKTAFRLARGGAAERYDADPDLVVLGKALANGFPLAAIGGRADVMRGVDKTWISSTLATDFVSLAAARASLEVQRSVDLPAHLARVGARLFEGLGRLATRFPGVTSGVRGIPEMCYLGYAAEDLSGRVARECARRGLLFKRTAYNFVSLAHRESDIDVALGTLEEVLAAVSRSA